jgi:hypothetical protein
MMLDDILPTRETRSGAHTVKELADLSGRRVPTTRDLLRAALAAGTWTFAGKRAGIGIDGRLIWVPTYRRTGDGATLATARAAGTCTAWYRDIGDRK